MEGGGFVPSWIQPADEVGHLAQGYQVGMALGARQAEQAFREQQMMRQQQLDAQQKAQWEAEFGLQSAAAARKTAAIQAYQSDIAGGMDPIQAIIKHGPSIGQQGTVEAAALRAAQQKEKSIQPPALKTFDLPGGGKQNIIWDQQTGSFKLATGDATMPTGPIQGHPVVDESGKPIPGLTGIQGPHGIILRNIPKGPDTTKPQRDLLKMDIERLNKTLSSGTEIDKAVTALMAKQPKLSLGDADRKVRQDLEKQLADLKQQYLSVGGEKPVVKKNEVRRITKDGKVAIFDADTKQFIRFSE